ncbi:MAG: site-2 protease family protein, partial [Acidilobaceae archaeon]
MVLESLSRLAVLALALAALWAILLALSRLRRLERVEVKPLLLIYRTGRVIEAGGSERRLYRVLRSFAWLGVPVAVLAAALFYYAVGEAVYYRYFSPEPPADGLQRGVVPLLPGVTIPIDVNLVLIAFSVGVAVLVHEVAHALSAVSLGLRVKDSGLILLAFIPAAFVEIDEESYKRASWSAKARVLTAGILGNVLLAIFSLGALALAPAPQPEAVVIESVDPGTPAERSGLRPG